jgi:hypothetical protein
MLVADMAAAQPPVPPPTIRMSVWMSGEPVQVGGIVVFLVEMAFRGILNP